MTRIGFFLLALITPLLAQDPDGAEILERIDQNLSSENRVFESAMIIHGRRGSRTIEARTWTQGDERSFSEYLAPAREKGTKMLKLEDQLWMYSPATDRTIQISGHMLRQSVMGSDLSYEDMMEDKRLVHHYEAVVVAEDTIQQRSCWVVELTARTREVAYYRRKLWVEKDRYIPLRQELYAKSGQLLKKMELSDIRKIDGRWYATRFLFKDMLKSGEGTEFLIRNIQFDIDIPDYIFTKAALRR